MNAEELELLVKFLLGKIKNYIILIKDKAHFQIKLINYQISETIACDFLGIYNIVIAILLNQHEYILNIIKYILQLRNLQ